MGKAPNETNAEILAPGASGASVDQVDCLVRADIDIGHIRRLTVGVFPAQIHVTILALRYFSPLHWPAFSAPSTFFQLAEPRSTTWSSTRSASRQFVTFTVTVPPAGVLGFDFMSAVAAGADSEF
jgi:hypothetical protein